VDENDKKEIADAIAAGVAASVLKKQDAANEVAFAKLEIKVEQLQKENELLWAWKKENEAVLLWSRGFMDNYKKVMTVVVTSGILTTIGLLFQLYYMLNKGK
jgi:phosphosulfolactate phosphohydrolase-like enzyme